VRPFGRESRKKTLTSLGRQKFSEFACGPDSVKQLRMQFDALLLAPPSPFEHDVDDETHHCEEPERDEYPDYLT
jgi:hypothetical protein